MKQELFDELLESFKEGGAILRHKATERKSGTEKMISNAYAQAEQTVSKIEEMNNGKEKSKR